MREIASHPIKDTEGQTLSSSQINQSVNRHNQSVNQTIYQTQINQSVKSTQSVSRHNQSNKQYIRHIFSTMSSFGHLQHWVRSGIFNTMSSFGHLQHNEFVRTSLTLWVLSGIFNTMSLFGHLQHYEFVRAKLGGPFYFPRPDEWQQKNN